jgi:hypothetical protein
MFQVRLAFLCGEATGLFCCRTSSSYTSPSISWPRNTGRQCWVSTLDPSPQWWSMTTTVSGRFLLDPNSRAGSNRPSSTCEPTTITGVHIYRQELCCLDISLFRHGMPSLDPKFCVPRGLYLSYQLITVSSHKSHNLFTSKRNVRTLYSHGT